jgi:hypothetical protein
MPKKKYYWVVSARFTARYDTYNQALAAWASLRLAHIEYR